VQSKRIFKYPFKIDETFKILMPVDAEILELAWDDTIRSFCMWALVDTKAEIEDREFFVFGTGHELPTKDWEEIHNVKLQYRKTLQDGIFVWHVFSVEAFYFEF
jgi:hypothetical protein